MSKLNQIQNALKEIDGGRFQKLADSYLIKKGYENINSLGSVIGADKARVGTPDSYSRQNNGKFAFFEHTTKKDDLYKKLEEDLYKCLDVNKTGILLEDIERIIFCHTSKLHLSDENKLYEICKSENITLEIYGVDGISFDLYLKYPDLAREFLGITVDSGQLVEAGDFIKQVGNNKISTPLDTEFIHREDELKKAVDCIGKEELLILSGGAGVGKTRLALKVAEEMGKLDNGYNTKVIMNKGLDLFEDLKTYFSDSGKFIIIVDDGNRLTQFEHVIDLIQNKRSDQDFKVIVTVRDYALDKIQDTIKRIGEKNVISLKPFSNDEISSFIKNQFGINNSKYIDRIVKVSSGNPRLAVMAASVAVEEDNLDSINDVSELYDQYFSTITGDLSELENGDILKVAGIVSLFRVVDRSNKNLQKIILDTFEITEEVFWSTVKYLHQSEIVDVYENEVVKINDQVLSTYLFYLCFFKMKLIKFSLILDELCPNHIEKIRDALYPCLNSFNYTNIESLIKVDVQEKWRQYADDNETDTIVKYLKVFWFLLKPDALIYVRDKIVELEQEVIDVQNIEYETNNKSLNNSPLLELLSLFKNAGEESSITAAIELALLYLQKSPSLAPQIWFLLTEVYGFDRFSHTNAYTIQKWVIDSILKKLNEKGDKLVARLFLSVSRYYLRTKFDSHETSGMTITIHNFQLLYCDEITSIRKSIWEKMFELYEDNSLKEDVINTFQSYMASVYYLTQEKIVKQDTEVLIPIFKKIYLQEDKKIEFILCEYRGFIKTWDIENNFLNEIESDRYNIYKVLSYEYGDCDAGSVEEFDKIRNDKLAELCNNYDKEDYLSLVEEAVGILSTYKEGRDAYQIKGSMLLILRILAKKDISLFYDFIDFYLRQGNQLGFQGIGNLLKYLIDEFGGEKIKLLLNESEYLYKSIWLFDFYFCIEKIKFDQTNLDELIELYRSSAPEELPCHFDQLLIYQNFDESIVSKVVSVLMDRYNNGETIFRVFDLLFNPHTEINKNLIQYFNKDLKLLKDAYFVYLKSNNHADYTGDTMNLLLSCDDAFIMEFCNFYYHENERLRYSDSRDYSFIWLRDDRASIVNRIIDFELEKYKGDRYLDTSFLEKIFTLNENKKPSNDIINNQDLFLSLFLGKHCFDNRRMKSIFNIISEFEPSRRIQFVSNFLEHNKKFEDFECLQLEPSHWGATGSMVPVLQERADYWEKLLPLCGSLELLDHRRYVERNLQYSRESVEAEKKREFMEDRF